MDYLGVRILHLMSSGPCWCTGNLGVMVSLGVVLYDQCTIYNDNTKKLFDCRLFCVSVKENASLSSLPTYLTKQRTR